MQDLDFPAQAHYRCVFPFQDGFKACYSTGTISLLGQTAETAFFLHV
jgi:hypothetical protein